MGKALYRKYRSKKLSEIIGQEHITDTLDRALKQGTLSHAYLLTGPRGTGKTSTARILAYEMNGLPYDEEGTHLDIIEIDAASNRRIDEIRDLKERVNIAPTSAKYKVYIIDEVHMLTKEAFNALLKTLEEPPEHAVFILATTEAHKVPETIMSRTQRFTFKPVDQTKVIAHLKHIAKSEKIAIDDDALALIAAHGEGSFRDSISLLDQVRHTAEHITLRDVQQAIGQAPQELLTNVLQAVGAKNIEAVSSALAALRAQGVQPPQAAKQLAHELRSQLIQGNVALDSDTTLELLQQLVVVPASANPELSLELALFGAALAGQTITATTSTQNMPAATVPAKKDLPKTSAEPTAVDIVKEPVVAKSPVQMHENTTWSDILAAIKAKQQTTLYGVARMASPVFEGNTLTLTFAFAFHQKRLSDAKNKQLLLNIIKEVTGQDVTLEFQLDKNLTTPVDEPVSTPPEDKAADNTNDLETISNIFGSAEVIE